MENAIVASYASDNLNGRPLFGSERSGKDGGYLLRVSGAGSYYLRVREVYGVGALDGENMLVHGGNTPKAVSRHVDRSSIQLALPLRLPSCGSRCRRALRASVEHRG